MNVAPNLDLKISESFESSRTANSKFGFRLLVMMMMNLMLISCWPPILFVDLLYNWIDICDQGCYRGFLYTAELIIIIIAPCANDVETTVIIDMNLNTSTLLFR